MPKPSHTTAAKPQHSKLAQFIAQKNLIAFISKLRRGRNCAQLNNHNISKFSLSDAKKCIFVKNFPTSKMTLHLFLQNIMQRKNFIMIFYCNNLIGFSPLNCPFPLPSCCTLNDSKENHLSFTEIIALHWIIWENNCFTLNYFKQKYWKMAHLFSFLTFSICMNAFLVSNVYHYILRVA